MELGENIQKARKAAGMTQKELAEKLGVSAPNISQYERGTKTPKIETVKRIAHALGVYWDTLYPEDEQAAVIIKSTLDGLEATGKSGVSFTRAVEVDKNGKPLSPLSLDDSITFYYQELNLYGKAATADYMLQHIGEDTDTLKHGLLVELKRLAAIPQYQRLEPTDTNGQ